MEISGISFYDFLGKLVPGTLLWAPWVLCSYCENGIPYVDKKVYVDNDGKGLFEITIKFQSDGPYKNKKKYTINSLVNRRYFTPEEVKEYNKLKAN